MKSSGAPNFLRAIAILENLVVEMRRIADPEAIHTRETKTIVRYSPSKETVR